MEPGSTGSPWQLAYDLCFVLRFVEAFRHTDANPLQQIIRKKDSNISSTIYWANDFDPDRMWTSKRLGEPRHKTHRATIYEAHCIKLT